MSVIAFISAAFTALADIKIIGGYAEDLASAITLWFVQRAATQTLSAISDAAALAARAKTDDDRYAAALAWQKALSRPRISA